MRVLLCALWPRGGGAGRGVSRGGLLSIRQVELHHTASSLVGYRTHVLTFTFCLGFFACEDLLHMRPRCEFLDQVDFKAKSLEPLTTYFSVRHQGEKQEMM